MPRLSSSLSRMEPHYEVVVVGSGYGGAIAASRLARAGRKVALLERGRERQPGEYPDTLNETARELQIDAPEGHAGDRGGMFDFHVNPDIAVLVGCGLGGTSLINANVSIEAEPRVFADPRWPDEVRADLATLVADGYRHAREMLKPQAYPQDWPALPKTAAHQESARALGAPFYRTAINVTFADGVNHVGVEQRKCSLCGDCVTGCNYSAKNTTLMTYLPDAHNHGAAIFTEAAVRHLERKDGRWVVWFEPLGAARARFDAPLLSVLAEVVVLGAGSLGSTEILLRSKAMGLALSDRLGDHFSGNGDVFGFGYAADRKVDGIGWGHRTADTAPVGPCITSIIDLREQPDLEAGRIIEEGSIPGALRAVLEAGFAAAQTVDGVPLADRARNLEREVVGLAERALGVGDDAAPLERTQTYLVMSHDGSEGRMALEDDRLRIRWGGVGKLAAIRDDNDSLARASKAIGGTWLPNPAWSAITNHNLITVHPLGGAVMASRAEDGVVNHKGQVFAGAAGGAVHDGLYVSDGAIVPRSLGVNPLLTISALAERNAMLLARDRGWTIDYALPSLARVSEEPRRLGVRFTEKMAGWFTTQAAAAGGAPATAFDTAPFAAAQEQGRKDASRLAFVLTITGEDLEAMMADPEYDAALFGTVEAPELSPQPLVVSQGRFNLFVPDPERVETYHMRYRMTLNAIDGRSFHFDGFKVVKKGSLLDVWPATTTLYTTVRKGNDSGPLVGRGILRIAATDFARQLTTMEVLDASSTTERLEALGRFGQFFCGPLWKTYGGVFAPDDVETTPRKRRPLRAPAPETHHFRAADGAELRLIRFQGGKKGPVLCAPGFGNSTYVFTFDAVDTNLAEFLSGHGYDTWLFDYRASPDLPVSSTQFTIDDIARQDWPAAVAEVRALTGARDVQVAAHCMGSMTCFMALLAGLEGVRTFVSSQLTPHPVVQVDDKVKAGLHLDAVLRLLGQKMVTTTPGGSLLAGAVDGLLRLYPVPAAERCDSPVCRRVFGIYGHCYKHAQLNQATHGAIGEMFGHGNMTAFSQILEILRQGRIVDQDGADAYLPHVGRLHGLPITILHGADNTFFLPEGSEKTYLWLRGHDDGGKVAREVIPGYAHLDCFIGKNAWRDVFPSIVRALEREN